MNVIYKITNKINGKIYIGQRMKIKDSYYGSGKLIKRAIKKYGKNNFTKEILEKCSTKEELNKKEVYWIKKLDSKIPNGYNISDGGKTNFGWFPTQAWRDKRKQILKEFNPRAWNKGLKGWNKIIEEAKLVR